MNAPYTTLDLLHRTREIVLDGGDPEPCEVGKYCIRCCLGIAQSDAQEKYCEDAMRIGFIPFGQHYTDYVLDDARKIIASVGDSGGITGSEVMTKESALKVIDAAIREYEYGA